MQFQRVVWILQAEGILESVAEQIVIAVPLPLLVGAAREHALAHQPREHLVAVAPSRQRGTQGAGQATDDRGVEQELPVRLLDFIEDLLDQVLANGSVRVLVRFRGRQIPGRSAPTRDRGRPQPPSAGSPPSIPSSCDGGRAWPAGSRLEAHRLGDDRLGLGR